MHVRVLAENGKERRGSRTKQTGPVDVIMNTNVDSTVDTALLHMEVGESSHLPFVRTNIASGEKIDDRYIVLILDYCNLAITLLR